MNIKKHIPNSITLSNLFCGIMAVKYGFEGAYLIAGSFIILGAVFDFFDGFVARLLGVSNAIGKELDSLADMVTFGVAPGVIIYSLLLELLQNNDAYLVAFIPYLAFTIPLASAVRLAKFNIDENQTDKFIGLPTPANSLFFLSLPLVVLNYVEVENNKLLVLVIIGLVLFFSWLLNANIELLALKFKSFSWKGNEYRFIFILLSVLILLMSFIGQIIYLSIPIIILLYIFISVLFNQKTKQTK